jgi:hypothetical protein
MYLGKVNTSTSHKRWFGAFTIIGVVVAAGIAYISLIKATVTIYPKYEQESSDFRITVAEKLDTRATASQIQGRFISADVQGSKTISDISKKEREQIATGNVTIINNSSKEQVLIPKTRLLTSKNVLFRITGRVTIPAGGKVDNVAIEADQPGKQGNIEPTRFTIPGLHPALQKEIYAESKTATTGGVQNIAVVDQSDIDKAIATTLDEAIASFIEDIKQELRSDEVAAHELVRAEIKQSTTSVKPESPATSFTVELQATMTTIVFNEQELRQLARTTYERTLPVGKELQTISDDSFTYTLASIDEEKKRATLDVNIAGETRFRLANQALDKSQLKGKTSAEVSEYLGTFNEIEKVDIQLWPNWITSFPSIEDKIEIIVKNKQE